MRPVFLFVLLATKLFPARKKVPLDKNPKGVLTGLPATISAFFLIRKYQKQAEEKEELYKKALAKHNAVIKELDAKAEMDKERQDRLLAYDSRLKKEMSGLQSEIQELKNQIAELEKKKADDE